MNAVVRPRPGFRPMQAADLPMVMAVEREIYAFPWTEGNFQDALLAGYSCWIMEMDRQLAGYGVLMVGVEECHLLNISVAAGWQRQGLGARLLSYLGGVARSLGAQRMLLEVRPSNVPARALYEGAGFVLLAQRRGYYPAPGGREDALVMEWAW